MKSKTFLLLLSIYYLIFGCLGLFNATGILQDFGLKTIDSYHIASIQYLAQTNLGLALIALLIRNTNQVASYKAFFWGATFLAFSAEIIGFYHIFIVNIAATTFSWTDTAIRLIVGVVSLYFAMRTEK